MIGGVFLARSLYWHVHQAQQNSLVSDAPAKLKDVLARRLVA